MSVPKPARYPQFTRVGTRWAATTTVPLSPALVGGLDAWRRLGWKEQARRELTCTGYGATRKAAHADLRRELHRRPQFVGAYVRHGVPDPIHEYTRMKMQETGILRRILPPMPADKPKFLRWGPDGRAVFTPAQSPRP